MASGSSHGYSNAGLAGMTIRFVLAAAVAVGAAAFPAAAGAAPVTVNLRVEGASQTLFEGPVTTYGHAVQAASDSTSRQCDGTNNGANPLPGGTATTALVDGLSTVDTNWDGTWSAPPGDYFVTRIGPDSQNGGVLWGLLDNYQFTPVSGCQTEVNASDQVLWAYDAFNAVRFLRLSASATSVAAGQQVTVTVHAGNSITLVSGATVAPVTTSAANGYETVDTGDPSAVTTDSSGNATLSWTTPGWKRVKAVASSSIRSNRLDICVTPCGPPPADTLIRIAGPTTTDNVPSTWSSSVTVTLFGSDPFSGVAKTYYTTGTNPADPTTASAAYDPSHKPVLANGEMIKYFSVNGGGVNEPVRSSLPAKVDSTPPATTDDVPAGWVASPVAVTLTASDGAGSGVAHTYYTVGTNPPNPTTASAVYDPSHNPVLANGQEIKYFSVDAVGNVETVATSTAAKVDQTRPATRDNVPAGWVGRPVAVTLTASDGDGSGVAHTYYTIGTNPPSPTTASAVYDPSHKPVLANGQEIKYFSVDAAGNVETVRTSTRAKVDRIRPATTDNVPTRRHTAPVTVKLKATDVGSGVAATYYTIGVHPLNPTKRSSRYNARKKPTVRAGQRIKYFSVDKVGNVEAVKTSAVLRALR